MVEYEFGGVAGALSTTFSLPLVIYFLYWYCGAESCSLPWSLSNPFSPLPHSFVEVFSWTGLLVFIGWFLFQAILHLTIPGPVVQGVLLANKTRLKYKINGLTCFFVSIGAVLTLHLVGVFRLTWVYDHFVELITAANIFSFVLAVYLYLRSMNMKTGLAPGGNTGSVIYDFFIGHELNPRSLGGLFDWKFFCELRPGLIGWIVTDLAMALKQYEIHGTITNSMILVIAFQTWYVFDALLSESAILTTMDITTDGFGFMLAFGDLAWVPFTYSLQARYLVDHPNQLSYQWVVIILALKLGGYYIFRGANGQKDTFRTNPNDPSVKHLSYITTSTGSKLITSGWWGIARHINYFGDLLMGLSWCLPCGFEHIIPYFYSIYFTILLVHRENRDEHKCQKKYGKDWSTYCKKVKWRIIPYVY